MKRIRREHEPGPAPVAAEVVDIGVVTALALSGQPQPLPQIRAFVLKLCETVQTFLKLLQIYLEGLIVCEQLLRLQV